MTAIATDNAAATRTSTGVPVGVASAAVTRVLQDAKNGYAGATDTYLDLGRPKTTSGTKTTLSLDNATLTPLVRFAIFASEGGPVPANATIVSATLALYKLPKAAPFT